MTKAVKVRKTVKNRKINVHYDKHGDTDKESLGMSQAASYCSAQSSVVPKTKPVAKKQVRDYKGLP